MTRMTAKGDKPAVIEDTVTQIGLTVTMSGAIIH